VEPQAILDPYKLAQSDKDFHAFGPHAMHQHFLKCIRDGRQPETNFDDAVKTMELVEAVLGSQI
jgi:predicted dehydrogenase